MNKRGKESLVVTLVSIVFALFIGFVLFTSYEPTNKILMNFLGQLATLFFIIAVIAIVGGIIFLVMYFFNNR